MSATEGASPQPGDIFARPEGGFAHAFFPEPRLSSCDSTADSTAAPSQVVAPTATVRNPRTALEGQRVLETPPLPRVFGDQLPRFEAVPGETRQTPFPSFAELLPLKLVSSGCDVGGGIRDGVIRRPSGQPDSAQILTRSESNTSADMGDIGCGSSESNTPLAPFHVGVVFAGQSFPTSPVNIVAGMLAYLAKAAPGSTVIGFHGGPPGFLEGRARVIPANDVLAAMNLGDIELLSYGTCSEGGFSGPERTEEARQAMAVCEDNRLDSLVIIGGSRDLSWAASLSVFFKQSGCRTTIVGVPHSKNLNMYVPHYMPITLGFDSASRMLSEIAGNVIVDSISSKKYWHFIRCGEDALTIELALQTRCTFSVLTRGGRSLMDTVHRLRDVVQRRREIGRRSGVVLLSRNLIETLKEMDMLREELLGILDSDAEAIAKRPPPTPKDVEKRLEHEATKELFKRLPRVVQWSLILKRDSQGMPLLPIDLEGERILGRFVQQSVKAANSQAWFAPTFHNMVLMGNAPLPSPFDCAFGYSLGHTAAALICERRTFYVACVANMHLSVGEWEPCAVPFSFLYPRQDTQNPALGWVDRKIAACMTDTEEHRLLHYLEIPKTSYSLRKNVFEAYQHFREVWVGCNAYRSPGPMQFCNVDGCPDPLQSRCITLLAEYLSLDELKQRIQPVMDIPPPLCIYEDPPLVRDVHVADNLSWLEQQRLRYKPALPAYLRNPVMGQDEEITPQACRSTEGLIKTFPYIHAQRSAVRIVPDLDGALDKSAKNPESSSQSLRFGIVFAGSQAPGFHTVVAGLFDYIAGLSPPGELIGFLGGYEGLVQNLNITVDRAMVDGWRNLGGQGLLCHFGDPSSLRFKDDLKAVTRTIGSMLLDGLVLLGNLECQADAAFIAEACAAEKYTTRVVGVPVSVDCDFPFVQQTIGYDTVCRTLSAHLGSLGRLAETTGHMWIFVRTMGNAWSHIAVQCTLQAHPSIALLAGGNYLGQSITSITNCLCDLIVKRHFAGYNHGVVLIPHGFVTDITEMRLLMSEIMEVMGSTSYQADWGSIPDIAARLKPGTAAIFDLLPRDVQYELCFSHHRRGGRTIDISHVSTDRLLLRFVEIELERRTKLGLYHDSLFHGRCFSMAYQARSAIPTNFDCDLAYTLGQGAGQLIVIGKTGHLVHAAHLEQSMDEWRIRGIPLSCLLTATCDDLPCAHHNHLLKLKGVERPFTELPPPQCRVPIYHGPVQYWGGAADHPSLRTSWYMENMPAQDPTVLLHHISALCNELQAAAALAKNESTLYTVNHLLSNAVSVLDSFKQLNDSQNSKTKSLADIPIQQTPLVARTKPAETARGSGDAGSPPFSPPRRPSRP